MNFKKFLSLHFFFFFSLKAIKPQYHSTQPAPILSLLLATSSKLLTSNVIRGHHLDCISTFLWLVQWPFTFRFRFQCIHYVTRSPFLFQPAHSSSFKCLNYITFSGEFFHFFICFHFVFSSQAIFLWSENMSKEFSFQNCQFFLVFFLCQAS